jgi:hypothetical protein
VNSFIIHGPADVGQDRKNLPEFIGHPISVQTGVASPNMHYESYNIPENANMIFSGAVYGVIFNCYFQNSERISWPELQF